jgi:hypothetical protein
MDEIRWKYDDVRNVPSAESYGVEYFTLLLKKIKN